MSQSTSQDIATFRDPAGSLRITGDHVLRTVHPRYAAESLRFLQSDLARRWTDEGHLIPSQVLSAEADQPLLLEHPRVFFPSYPWEWTPGQWVAAGELTLELCGQLLHEGWILKDATPLNILFDGLAAGFCGFAVDRASRSGQPVVACLWPICAHLSFASGGLKYLGWPLAATLNRRDGYEPVDLYPYLSGFERWSAPLRSLVTLPYLLEKPEARTAGAPPKLHQEPEIAAEVLERNLRGFGKTLHALEPKGRDSRWSGYQAAADHYSEQERQHKQEFVDRAMQIAATRVGAGYRRQYRSILAHCCRRWRARRRLGHRRCLLGPQLERGQSGWPADPSAGRRCGQANSGGRMAQYASLSPLLERAHDRFDCVMMLGILHHLLLADQIPMADVAALLASLTRRSSIVEWVPKTDVRYIDLCRGRDELYQHLNEALFVEQFTRYFTIMSREELTNGRVLFLFEKR